MWPNDGQDKFDYWISQRPRQTNPIFLVIPCRKTTIIILHKFSALSQQEKKNFSRHNFWNNKYFNLVNFQKSFNYIFYIHKLSNLWRKSFVFALSSEKFSGVKSFVTVKLQFDEQISKLLIIYRLYLKHVELENY